MLALTAWTRSTLRLFLLISLRRTPDSRSLPRYCTRRESASATDPTAGGAAQEEAGAGAGAGAGAEAGAGAMGGAGAGVGAWCGAGST